MQSVRLVPSADETIVVCRYRTTLMTLNTKCYFKTMFARVLFILCIVSVSLAAPSTSVNTSISDAQSRSRFSIGEPHIVGGNPVDAPIPYQISLRVRAKANTAPSLDPRLLVHICGGSLIARDVVLTAAHCLKIIDGYLITVDRLYAAGGTELLLFNPSTTFISKVKAFMKHESYSEERASHDVAVLKLESPAPVDDVNINIVPLRSNPTPLGPSQKCRISGWGTTKFGDPAPSTVLRAANVSIVPFAECWKIYDDLIIEIFSDMVCAGEKEGGIDSCQGDSGGPLVCNGELTGVVSSGHKCAEPGIPGLYTSVVYYGPWIATAIKKFDQTPNPAKPPATSSSAKLNTHRLAISLIFTVVIIRIVRFKFY